MASTNILMTDDNVLAEYVPLEPFKGILEQRLGIGPDNLALLIRDGEIVDAAHGAHISIGGIWRNIKDTLGGQHALRLLIADLKPFQLTTEVKAVSKDSVPITGELVIDFQINPEKPANVLGLMKERSVVVKSDALKRLMPHLGERVLEAAVRRLGALELRGNVALQDRIQADAMQEAARLADDLGLLVRSATVSWAFNDDEIAAIEQRAKAREQEMLEQDFRILQREVEREGQSTILKLTTNLDIEKVKSASEAELRRMVLEQELDFIDGRETGVRLQEMKTLKHELDLNNEQRRDGLMAEIEATNHQIALTRQRGAQQGVDLANDEALRRYNITAARLQSELRDVQRSTEELDTRHRLALNKLEEVQKLELARQTNVVQTGNLRDLNKVNQEQAEATVRLEELRRQAEADRALAATRLAQDAELAKINALKNSSPELVLALNAGLSPAVANVLIAQAQAKIADGGDKMQLMREMIAQANDARLTSDAQARTFFANAMQGATGVAQGVGAAAAVARGDAAPAVGAGGTTECLACHRVIPVTQRFCQYCGHQMRT